MKSIPPFKVERKQGELIIMMLDRGPRMENHTACFFLDKVYNAQQAGADAVIVANDEPGELSTAVAPMDDDTAGELQSISISAAMVGLEDAVLLRRMLRNGPVTVLLNWTSIVPASPVVNWEFWTNSNDECGFSCREQLDFIKGMKDRAQSLETAGRAKFTPHYLLWNCPEAFLNTTECLGECIMNGTYCVPDPDNDPTRGYSGRDVLMMNMRQLCFYRLASAAGKGLLWWDYAITFAAQCNMTSKTYTPECAATVFEQLGGAALVANNGGRAAWEACFTFNETAALAAAAAGDVNATRIQILEDELVMQRGNTTLGVAPVSILPSLRINGHQYRGSLDVSSVTRAICAGFPAGQEPSVCNQAAISEDECAAPDGVGYLACMASDMGLANMTRCVNTFSGYSCECKGGMYKYTNPDTGQERCEDVNECLATNVQLTDPACSCERCACVNAIGAYKCTGPLENKCTAAANWGGCWSATVQGKFYHACVDDLSEFQRMAARGLTNTTSGSWTRCECPKCFRATSTGGCEPACGPDLNACDPVNGFCGYQPYPSDGGGSGSGSKSGGVSVGFLFFIVLASAGMTAGVVLLANRYLMRQRMGDEIRDIMAQYMPLQEQRERSAMLAARNAAAAGGRRDHGSGIRPDEDSDEEGTGVGAYGWPAARPAAAPAAASGPLGPLGGPSPAAPTLVAASQRSVWGPPPVTAAAVAPAPNGGKSAAGAGGAPPASSFATATAASTAPTAQRPSVDVFTLGGPDDDPLLPASSSAAANRAASDADPLLGREVASSASNPPPPADNPFL
ncbi:hypothetical protein GPECTOR_18g38 [Gonium pectorale]|uniref:Uncharacterized protein n=1 Tax=Gonium pectorale TaxID=33097 RepID=A0A150GJR0_GONPE|nr:hypothetical protein GPECTOR_18g38 [Gonium pectorale]|eukprot:KXZ50058.1 hypothetical protein GPECTOR_18g38 [Gonium pectorale]